MLDAVTPETDDGFGTHGLDKRGGQVAFIHRLRPLRGLPPIEQSRAWGLVRLGQNAILPKRQWLNIGHFPLEEV